MRKQLAKIKHNGVYIVYYDDKRKYNKYVITYTWHKNGSKHTKILNAYDDETSCIFYMTELLLGKEIRTI